MPDMFERTSLLIGESGINKLKAAKVLVIGIGGVGSYAVEALARAGVGSLTLADGDKFCTSNINRQLYALNSTVGQYKCIAAKQRIADINESANVTAVCRFIDEENLSELNIKDFDFVVEAIDDVPAKVSIICEAVKNNVKIISCMGTGNKLNPQLLKIADISKTYMCPLAKSVRIKLKKCGITKGVQTVFSTEEPVKHSGNTVGSVSFVPSAAGLLMASHVINELIK